MEITPKIGYFTSILCGYQISLFLLVGKWVEKEKIYHFQTIFHAESDYAIRFYLPTGSHKKDFLLEKKAGNSKVK